jgi:hypothetical protein
MKTIFFSFSTWHLDEDVKSRKFGEKSLDSSKITSSNSLLWAFSILILAQIIRKCMYLSQILSKKKFAQKPRLRRTSLQYRKFLANHWFFFFIFFLSFVLNNVFWQNYCFNMLNKPNIIDTESKIWTKCPDSVARVHKTGFFFCQIVIFFLFSFWELLTLTTFF